MPDDSLARGFRIGDHLIEPDRGRIVSPAGEAHLEPRAMDVLVALARRPGETMSRDALIEAVWKHPHVSDEALSRCISLVRQAFGDDRSQPRYLETIPKRGYRLIAPVAIDGADRISQTPDWSKTNLMLQPTRLIGRGAELAEVRALLAEQRLVTLTGSGGVGKTRLALEVGLQAMPGFTDGVWLVELAPLSDAERIPTTIAAVLGIEMDRSKSPFTELVTRLSQHDVLLILDNCEHLIDGVATLAETLLGRAPNLRLLATSQMLLRIAGEQAYRVPSLSVPDERLALDRVIEVASVQLFIERARAADSHFVIDGNAAAIAAICRRLDGIPLALEMAAARAPMLGVEALAQLLDERFRVLTGGRRTALARQQTLRATFDWSVNLLSEHERTVFSRLGIFAGGFTLEAASAVASDEAIDAIEVIDVLAQLIARSLVVADTHATGKRYRLLETTRAYALERLGEADDGGAAARTRHLDFFLALAERAEPQLRGADQGKWLALLDLERENLLAAHSWCDHAPSGGTLGLRLVGALTLYWIHSGGTRAGHRVALEALARTDAQARDRLRARALSSASQFETFMGRHEQAQAYIEASLAISREVGDDEPIAKLLLALGERCFAQGKMRESREHIEEALPLARRLGGTVFSGALRTLGELNRVEGHLDAAEQIHEESLALGRSRGAHLDVILALLNLASVSIARGAVGAKAAAMLLEALALIESIGSKILGANLVLIAAGLAADDGAWSRAARLFGAGDAQCQQLGFEQEPADAAFLSPLVARTRHALGPAAFTAAETAGRALTYDEVVTEVRAWLQECTRSSDDSPPATTLPPGARANA